ncbi:MAG TPA: coenzyme F420-0:L-glutamate ligase [Actinomycetes bacterium]|nr:coenzyme F420-0:L-glutamate ligase [Actinomycetes bacterium]HEX2158272.1 coenzyme F420-0:L-glutamate ligase [Actinomycetes bacterium]
MNRTSLVVVPLAGMPEVGAGDDLARLLLEAVGRAGLELADGDVLAVTSKVVAKAEGRTVPLPEDPAARERVLAETVAAETARVVARRGRLVIAETRTGLVGANALVDASNAGGDQLVLLPADPDVSAARLRAAIEELDGHDVAVVITDTLGRPWRLGQTDVAVGLAGMGALEDWRGRADGDGRLLEITEVAVADEVAAAADLVKGKASRVPAALLRGVPRPKGDGTARDLVRSPSDDLFRTAGTAEDLLAFLEGGGSGGGGSQPVYPSLVDRAAAVAATVPIPGGRRFRVVPVPDGARAASLAACSPIPAGFADAPTLLACCLDPGGGPEAGTELAAGAALRTLLLSLHALGVEASFQPADRRELGAALGLEPGWEPLGLLSAGHPG